MKSLVVARAEVWLNGLKLRTKVVVCSELTVNTVCAIAGKVIIPTASAAVASNLLFNTMRLPFLSAGRAAGEAVLLENPFHLGVERRGVYPEASAFALAPLDSLQRFLCQRTRRLHCCRARREATLGEERDVVAGRE